MLAAENLNFYDTNFLRKLTSKTSDSARREWQIYFAEIIQCKLPYSNLFTPFSFHEMIGVPNQPRPDFSKSFISESNNGLTDAERAAQIIDELFDEALDHYQKLPDLQTGELLKRANIHRNKFTSDEPLICRLVEDTIVRFQNKNNFEEELRQTLAIDALQHLLDRQKDDEFIILLQLMFLKKVLELNSEEYNISFLRLIRAIYYTVASKRPEILKNGKFKLKGKGDLVDTEVISFAICGLMSERISRPVRVFTCDPIETISERISIAKWILNLFTSEILQDIEAGRTIKLPTMSPGSVVVCSADECHVISDLDVKSFN